MSEYWGTEEGLLKRIDLLADQVQLGTFNNAVKVYATSVGVTDFTIAGELKPTSCEWCELHVGKTYRYGMFLPNLPRHPHCPHWFDIARVGPAPEPEQGLLEWIFSS